ncbi:hypothetical protein [Actinoplanes sp. HUAS TT8]|uniref:hypothetical protein n=1 Tax=Actinoplanes sp. HUAS TT8 TaxID=3447453 RepID=UPI003F5232F3
MRNLINRVWRRLGWAADERSPRPVDRRLALARIGDGGAILALAADEDENMRGAALDVLGGIAAPRWPALDQALRYSPGRVWDISDTLRLVVQACHRDGRVREAAVVRLAGRSEAAVVAVLALRAGDWVPEVRRAARSVIAGREALPFVALAFVLGGRREGAWLVSHVEASMRDMPLDELMRAPDRRVRRAACRTAIAAGRWDQERLVEAAVRDPDLVIRTMCARAAVAGADVAQLRAMAAGRTALVRAEAVRALVARGEVVEAALSDRSSRVREIVQTADSAVYYRRLMELVPAEPSIIAGLGETGGPEDAELLIRGLAHPWARGRAEAVRALRRVGVTRAELLVPLLRDESAAVTREAVRSLRREFVDPEVLGSLLGQGNPAHVRFAGFGLLTGGDVWERLATDLRVIDDPDRRLRAAARSDLAAWLRSEAATSYGRPGAGFDQLIERARPALGDDRVRLLRFHAGLT